MRDIADLEVEAIRRGRVTREAQVAESSKQLELQQEEQKKRDIAAASRLKEAQEELERLKEEMFSSTGTATLISNTIGRYSSTHECSRTPNRSSKTQCSQAPGTLRSPNRSSKTQCSQTPGTLRSVWPISQVHQQDLIGNGCSRCF